MAGGSSGGDSTVTNRTEIDPVTQAWRSSVLGAGTGLYNQGTPSPYPNSQVVPFADQTWAGLNHLQNNALQGAPNLAAAQNASARTLSGWNPAMGAAANAAHGGLAGNQAMAGLSQFGQGQNPHLQSLFNQGAEQVGNAVNSNFMQAGRFGPNAAHSGAMGRELGNLWTNINMPAYESERNRGLQAQQTMGGLYDQGQNRTLAGIDLYGGLHAQGNENAMRAQALLPGLYDYSEMPGRSLIGVGGANEALASEYMQDDVARYYQPYQSAWDHINNYSSLMSGLPDMSGSTQQMRGPPPNRAMGALGGATMGAQAGSYFGPWGTAIGAVAGGLFGGYGGG